ncbi:MAG: hypothetical protein JO086_15215 [Acidimicrobiia bacterium]|nr:hypothetical protein [Acidimicrobiia bacterium]
MPLIGVGLLGAAAFALPYFEADVPQWLPLNRLTGGPKVDDQDIASGQWLAVDPAQLAASAGQPLNTYSLGRAIRSEAGSAPAAERTAVGWAIWNHANAHNGGDVTASVTNGPAEGFYGAQNIPHAVGEVARYCSTRFAPRQSDLDLAQQIIDGTVADNTAGGEYFFKPGLQDRLVKAATGGYRQSAQAHIDSMVRGGYEVFRPAGTSDFIVFRRPAGLVVS